MAGNASKTERINMARDTKDPNEVITVYHAADAIEAHFVKNLLLASGIQATAAEVNEPLAGLPIVPPDVMVRRIDEAAAESVIADYEDKKRQRLGTENWTCPKCEASVPATFDECYQCGTPWPD